MINVFVQVWGPISGAPNCYDWITVGKIETEKIDIDYLKTAAVDIIRRREYKPFTNAARLKLVKNEKTEMQITMTGLW